MKPNKNKSKNVYGLYNLAIITLKKVEKQNRELRAKLKEEEDRADSRFTEALKEQAKEIKDWLWDNGLTGTMINDFHKKWVGKE